MRSRSRMLARDRRTTRLERAVDLIEDGYVKGLIVKKGTADGPHPLDRPFTIPVDRTTIKGWPYREVERGDTFVDIGFAGLGPDYQRGTVGGLRLSTPGFAVEFVDTALAYPMGMLLMINAETS